VEGTMKFYIHYTRKASQVLIDGQYQKKGKFGRKKIKKVKDGANDNEKGDARSEQFESKFVN